jgi:uncharacterized protein with GYD domain
MLGRPNDERRDNKKMAHFLFQGSYTTDTWATLANHPEGEEDRLRTLAEKAGGKLVNLFYSFGQHDVLAVLEAPDTNTAAALAIALNKPGHLRDIATTALFSNHETVASLRKAGAIPFRGPSGSAA